MPPFAIPLLEPLHKAIGRMFCTLDLQTNSFFSFVDSKLEMAVAFFMGWQKRRTGLVFLIGLVIFLGIGIPDWIQLEPESPLRFANTAYLDTEAAVWGLDSEEILATWNELPRTLPPQEDIYLTVAVGDSRLNIRKSPSSASTSLAKLYSDDTVKYLNEKSGSWVKVESTNGTVGWVSADYVRGLPD